MTHRQSSVSLDSLEASETFGHGLPQEAVLPCQFLINSQDGCNRRETSNGNVIDEEKWVIKKFTGKEKWEANISKESINIYTPVRFIRTEGESKQERHTETKNSLKPGHLKPPLPKGKVRKENSFTGAQNDCKKGFIPVINPEIKIQDAQFSADIKVISNKINSIFGHTQRGGATNDVRDKPSCGLMTSHDTTHQIKLDIKCKINSDNPDSTTKFLNAYPSRINGHVNINGLLKEESIIASEKRMNIQTLESSSHLEAGTKCPRDARVFLAHINSCNPKFNEILLEKERSNSDVSRIHSNQIANHQKVNPIQQTAGLLKNQIQKYYSSNDNNFVPEPREASTPLVKEMIFIDNSRKLVSNTSSEEDSNKLKKEDIYSASIQKETLYHNVQLKPTEKRIIEEETINSSVKKSTNQNIIAKHESTDPLQQGWPIDEQFSDSDSTCEESSEELDIRINTLLNYISATSLQEENNSELSDENMTENEHNSDCSERYEFDLKSTYRKVQLVDNKEPKLLKTDAIEDKIKSSKHSYSKNIKFPTGLSTTSRFDTTEFEKDKITQKMSHAPQKSILYYGKTQRRSYDEENSCIKDDSELSSIDSLMEIKIQKGDSIKCDSDVKKKEPQHNFEQTINPQLLFLPPNITKYLSKYLTRSELQEKTINTKALMSELTQIQWPEINVNPTSNVGNEHFYIKESSPGDGDRDSECIENIISDRHVRKRQGTLENEDNNNVVHPMQVPLHFRNKSNYISVTDKKTKEAKQNPYNIRDNTYSSKSKKAMVRVPIKTRNHAADSKNLSWMKACVLPVTGKTEIRNDMVSGQHTNEENVMLKNHGVKKAYWQKRDQVSHFNQGVTPAQQENAIIKLNGLAQQMVANRRLRNEFGNKKRAPSSVNQTSPLFFKIENIILQQALLSTGDDDDNDDSQTAEIEKQPGNMTENKSSTEEEIPEKNKDMVETLETENNPNETRGSFKENASVHTPPSQDITQYPKEEKIKSILEYDSIASVNTRESKILGIQHDLSDEANVKMLSGNESNIHLEETPTNDNNASNNTGIYPNSYSIESAKLLEENEVLSPLESKSKSTLITSSRVKHERRTSAEAVLDMEGTGEEPSNNHRGSTSEVSQPILPIQSEIPSITQSDLHNVKANDRTSPSVPDLDTRWQKSPKMSITYEDFKSDESHEVIGATKYDLDRKLEPIDEENTLSSEEFPHLSSPNDDKVIERDDVLFSKVEQTQTQQQQETTDMLGVPRESQDISSSINQGIINKPEGLSHISIADTRTHSQLDQPRQSFASTEEKNCSYEKNNVLFRIEGSMLKNKFLSFFENREALENNACNKEKWEKTKEIVNKKSKRKQKKMKLGKENESCTMDMDDSTHIGQNGTKISTESSANDSNMCHEEAREPETLRAQDDGNDERIYQDENGDWIVIFV